LFFLLKIYFQPIFFFLSKTPRQHLRNLIKQIHNLQKQKKTASKPKIHNKKTSQTYISFLVHFQGSKTSKNKINRVKTQNQQKKKKKYFQAHIFFLMRFQGSKTPNLTLLVIWNRLVQKSIILVAKIIATTTFFL
jgi:hypothetical protein